MIRNNRFAWLGVAAIPAIAFVLHDFVFQLPDNEGDVTVGFLLTIAGLLVVWSCCGYFIARGGRRSFASLGLGAFSGVVSVALLWMTFVVLNSLFIDRMSYEPDRIRAFQQSGYATMREYWDHQHGCGPFPLLMFVAAVLGSVGAGMRRASSVQRL
jgi:MFS family permease